MDLRRWHWSSPWAKRSHLICCCVLLLGLISSQVKASENSYHQESKNEVQDTNKLDSLRNYLPYDSSEDSEHKRASAFFPLRGKKPSAEELRAQQLLDLNQEEDKRAQFFPLRGKKVPDDLKRASYFMPMRGRKDGSWAEEDYDVADENPNKRASSFMPMRGKKRYASISDYISKTGTYSDDVNPSDIESQNPDKRLHSFVPVRGKRSLKGFVPFMNNTEPLNELIETVNRSKEKRSLSFMPLRGRRDFEEIYHPVYAGIATTLVEKKKQSFMPMRGRKDDKEIDKKASGFLPMRGKKESNDVISEIGFDVNKMSQSSLPMQERRTELRDIVFENAPKVESKLVEHKRGSSSFMPMRGKRSVSEEIKQKSEHVKKSSSFMPMRGKRSLLSVEDNTLDSDSDSDKNIIYVTKENKELTSDIEDKPSKMERSYSALNKKSSGFMPMRGRRYFDEDSTVAPWQPDQLMSLLNKKSSFMPMRGRRYFDEDSTVAPWQPDQLMSLLDKKSAFMPMRGRRIFDEDSTVAPLQPDQLMSLLDKKSAFMPMRGRRYFDEDSTVSPFEPDQLMSLLNKKSAFMPMRGRRYFDEDSTVAPWQPDQLMSLFDKKAAFMPMQDHKYSDEDFTVAPWQPDQLMSLFNKKSEFPQAGSRQENLSNDSLLEMHNEINSFDKDAVDKRSSSFMPMRGRRLEKVSYFYNPYTYLMAGMGSSLMSKPYSNKQVSFTSPRSLEARKKKLRINWDSVKRAFHATRGKRFGEIDDLVDSLKDNLSNDSHETINQSLKESEHQTRSKRSVIRPRMSIQPIRQYIALKRPMSFFATRGKRMDESGIDTLSKLR